MYELSIIFFAQQKPPFMCRNGKLLTFGNSHSDNGHKKAILKCAK